MGDPVSRDSTFYLRWCAMRANIKISCEMHILYTPMDINVQSVLRYPVWAITTSENTEKSFWPLYQDINYITKSLLLSQFDDKIKLSTKSKNTF